MTPWIRCLVVLFLGCFGPGAHAISPDDDPWEYCATNHAWAYACFGSLQEAEDWLREEPLEPTGRRFLEPSGRVDLFPTPHAPTQVQLEYRVKNRPPRLIAESYVSAAEITSSTHGLYCGCFHGNPSSPHCYRLGGPIDICRQNPGYCHSCVTEDAAPIREALLERFADSCDVEIVGETPWPEPANYVTGRRIFNDQIFPGGSFAYHNGKSTWIVPPQPPLDPRTPFNKVIAIRYGQLVNGQCSNPVYRNLHVNKDQRFECDPGLSPPQLRWRSQHSSATL